MIFMSRKHILCCVSKEAKAAHKREPVQYRPGSDTQLNIFIRELTRAATVVGLRSDDNRKFFREDSLTLQKVTDICRTAEIA